MSEDPVELTPELLEDFYAECEEQLSNARAQLALLETGGSEAVALESFYRGVHSFKGNAAIVGLADAERLAHAAEGLLRRLTRGETPLDSAKLDLLGRVVQRLEEIVGRFRAQETLPSIDNLLPLLESISPPVPNAAERAPTERVAASAPAPAPAGGRKWRVTFQPAAERESRGVNVNSVRARLSALGTIETAKPVIESGGNVRFEFVAVTRDAPDLAGWNADGVEWEAIADAVADAPETSNSGFGGSSQVVRVNLARLDELMRIAGEMVIQRSRLQDRIASLGSEGTALQEVNQGFLRSLRDLRAAIMRVRLVPISEVFSRLPFVVRDLTRGSEKQVELVIEGADTEIDKHLVERLKEPLLHLVRNAVSHGTETTEERRAAGKPAQATLRLTAEAHGDAVLIRVRDDGRGVDSRAVLERAQSVGLAVPAIADERALLRLICTPGFSTRSEADRVAGRGVGMAVVDATLRELGGSLSLSTAPGRFTEFTLRLPLTLAIADTFVVTAGEWRCAVPQSCVTEIVQMSAADIHALNDAEAGPYRGEVLPIVRLRRLFDLPPSGPQDVPVLVVETEQGRAGLAVDRIVGHREVVVRPLRDPFLRVPGVSGATELGDGKPVLILDPQGLGDAAALRRRDSRRGPVVLPQLAS